MSNGVFVWAVRFSLVFSDCPYCVSDSHCLAAYCCFGVKNVPLLYLSAFWVWLRWNGFTLSCFGPFAGWGLRWRPLLFFLSTLSLAITASSNPDAVFKQLVAILLGIGIFLVLCWYLRDLNRAKKIRWPLIIFSVILLLINIVFGTAKYGAQNWVSFAGFSIQPSEVVKLFFIFAGAATLDELFQKGNLTVFIIFSGFCLGCLALMGDFGTAAIFSLLSW